jgi:hypothetical protein
MQVMKLEWITVLVAESIVCVTQGLSHDNGSVHDSSQVEVKFTSEQALKAQRGSRGIVCLSVSSALDGGG